MYYYTAYKLNIGSGLALPELIESSVIDEACIDLMVVEGLVDTEQVDQLTQVGPFLYGDANTILLTVPDIARFLVQDGNKITFQRLSSSSDDDIRTFLLGSCIAAILIQRGYLVLHGSAVKVDDGCVICVGKSTAGKSTLAATFMQQGYTVISDDVAVIDQYGELIPGIPRIKINRDVANELEIATNGLRVIRAKCDRKFSLPITQYQGFSSLPVLAVYELSEGTRETSIEPELDPFKRFALINKNLYRPRYIKALSKRDDTFTAATKFAHNHYLARLNRPRYQFTAKQLVALIVNDLSDLQPV